MSTETDKYKVLVRLHQQELAVDIAQDLGVSYAKVLRIRTEYNEAKANDTLSTLLALSPESIAEIGEALVEAAPSAGEAIGEFVSSVSGMQRLQTEFQGTASFLSNRIRVAASTAEHTSELLDLTKAMCELQNAFFNKNITQVNVQNNHGDGGSGYGEFLSDTPGKS